MQGQISTIFGDDILSTGTKASGQTWVITHIITPLGPGSYG